jgi:hypothetical protein
MMRFLIDPDVRLRESFPSLKQATDVSKVRLSSEISFQFRLFRFFFEDVLGCLIKSVFHLCLVIEFHPIVFQDRE